MGLDVKEKNLIKFLFKFLIPSISAIYLLRKYFFVDNFLGMFGFLALLKIAFNAILRPSYNKLTRNPKPVKSYGKWAIVTGATSGIGENFAHHLAGEGMNLLLISRTASKLEQVCLDCEAIASKGKNGAIKTKFLAYDYGTSDREVSRKFYEDLKTTLKSCDDGNIGMLINNVGLSNENPLLTHMIPEEEIEQMLRVNNDGTLKMSRAVIPFMMERKSGAVITVSSASCTHPTPMLSVYSATKGFGNQLTRSMAIEYKEFGIDCLSITPYYFVSNMFKRNKATYMAPFPQALIDEALPLLGHEIEAYPYWGHWLMGQIALNYYDTGNGLLQIMKRNKARADASAARKAAAAKKD